MADVLELGQQTVGLSVALPQASQLEALALKTAHRPGRGPALTHDAGGEEQLPHVVSGHGLRACELGQVNGEHCAKKRLVGATECPAKVLFGRRTSIGASDADELVRSGIALDSPLPVIAALVVAALGQCEPATVAPAPHGRAESGIVAAAGKAEQHCGEEVEQRRLSGFVRSAHYHQARGEVVDREVGQPPEAVDVEPGDAHGDGAVSVPVAFELAEREHKGPIDELDRRQAR